MLPALIMMAAQAIPAIWKSLSGASQIAESKEGLKNLVRPEYKMPEEIARALKFTSQAYADPYMPGQGVMTDRTEQQAANAYKQSVEAGNPFAAIGNIQANSNASLQNIGVASANYQANDLQRMLGMLQTVAGYRDQEYQMNKFAPYAEKAQEFRDMFGAGNKNLYGGIDQLSGAVGSMGSALLSQQQLATNQKNTQSNIKALGEILGKYGQQQSQQNNNLNPTYGDVMDVNSVWNNFQNSSTSDSNSQFSDPMGLLKIIQQFQNQNGG